MKKQSLFLLIIIFITISLIPFSSEANSNQDNIPEQITENLYSISGFGGNVAFLVDKKGVFVVDAGTLPAQGKQIKEIIQKVTDKPIKYIALTHYHPDHVNGLLGLLDKNVKVISHENLVVNYEHLGKMSLKNKIEVRYPDYISKKKEELKNFEEGSPDAEKLQKEILEAEIELNDLKAIKPIRPDIVFTEKHSIKLGKNTIDLIYLGSGHTSGNIIVRFNRQKTVHMGDLLFHEAFPYIDYNAKCDTENWIKILNEVKSWKMSKVIPGHGEITDNSGLTTKANYLTDLRSAVAKSIDEDITLKDMKESIILGKYSDFKWPFYLPIGIEAVYNEMTD